MRRHDSRRTERRKQSHQQQHRGPQQAECQQQ